MIIYTIFCIIKKTTKQTFPNVEFVEGQTVILIQRALESNEMLPVVLKHPPEV